MKLKIKNKIYDAEKEPVMIVFKDDKEKDFIAERIYNMGYKVGERKYCAYPKDYPIEKIEKFVRIKNGE